MSDESLQARSYKKEQLQGEVAPLAEIAAEYKVDLGDVSPQERSMLTTAKDTETLREMMKLLAEHKERMRDKEERRQREKEMWDEEERRK